MEDKTNKKGRLLYLLQFLYKNIDENNPVSTNEIIGYFTKRDMLVTHKTVEDDLDILVEAGLTL